MDGRQDSQRADELLDQLGWVRALAGSLVADGNVADDVLQQVCLLALQRTPMEAREGPRLRAWLATVTRRLVAHGARATSRRAQRELAAATRDASVPSAADVAQRREALRAVVEAVAGLDEADFTVIVDRYFHGFAVTDIASRGGVSDEAIRQRLSRARQRLRLRLQRLLDDGERGPSLRALLPLAIAAGSLRAFGEGAGATTDLATRANASTGAGVGGGSWKVGGLWMAKSVGVGTSVKWAGTLLVVAVLALLMLKREPGGDPGNEMFQASSVQPQPESMATEVLPAPVSPVEVIASPAEPSESAAAPNSAVARWTGPMSTFTGRVVDHDGRPLVGATVTYWPSAETCRALDMHRYGCLGPEIDPALQTDTSDDGSFVLRAPMVPFKQDKNYVNEREDFPVLLVDVEGYAVRAHVCKGLLSGDYDAGTIAVEPGGTLIGRVVDERGEPIPAARVVAHQGKCKPAHVIGEDDWESYRQIDPVVSDVSGPDGRFELGGFWPGTAVFWITAQGFSYLDHPSEPIEVSARRDVGDIVMTRAPALDLSGLVIDAEAKPILGATVRAEKADAWQFGANLKDPVGFEMTRSKELGMQSAETDADGHFTLTGLEQANYRLCIGAAGFESQVVSDVGPGAELLHLTLVHAATLKLRISNATTQEPVAVADIAAVRRIGKGEKDDLPEPSLPVQATAEPGIFVVDQIGTWRTDVVVAAKGFATTTFSIDGVKPPESVERRLELRPEARVQGRVLAADGMPLAGATVTSAPLKDAIKLPAQAATSGADGRFELGGLARGECTLRAEAPGFVRADRSVTIPQSGSLTDVDIVLDAGATIFGTRFDADGRPLPGKGVTLLRQVDPRTDGDALVVPTDVRGDYRAEGLRSGSWKVIAGPEIVVEVAPGQSVRIDLRDSAPIVVRGTVVAGGQPMTGAFVMALSVEMEKKHGFAQPVETVKAGTDGRYEMKLSQGGEYYMQAAGFDPPCGGSNVVPVTVAEGDQRVVDLEFGGERVSILVVEAGTARPLEGVDLMLFRASAADPLTPTFSFGNTGDGIEFWPHTDAEGRAMLPFTLPGSYSLQCKHEGHVTESAQVTVVAGSPQEVRVELAAAARLRGIVKLSSGVLAKDGLRVTLREGSADEREKSTSTESGQFVFEGLLAGDYTLAIRDRSTGTPKAPSPPLIEVPVTLKPGESKTVDLVVPN